MTITWVNNVPNPAGQMGDDHKVLVVSGADGVSAVNIGSLPRPNDGSMVFSIWWKGASATTASVTALGATATGNITTDWSRFYVTIPTPTGSTINILPPSGAPDIYMAMAQLEMGEVPSDWRESQDGFATKTELNIVDGKVETVVETVDSVVRETATPGQYQVYVAGNNSMVAEDNGTTVMQITPSMFYVNTSVFQVEAPNQSLRMDGDGASMDNLTVNNSFYAPNIVSKYEGKSNIYVSLTMTPTDQYDVYPSLAAVFEALSYKILPGIQIEIKVTEDQYGNVFLWGVTGARSITVMGWDTDTGTYARREIVGRFGAFNCTCTLAMAYLNFAYSASETISQAKSRPVVIWSNCPYVRMNVCQASSPDQGRSCIFIEWGTNLFLREVAIYPYYSRDGSGGANGVGITANETTKLVCYNISGQSEIFLRCKGAVVIWAGTRPQGQYDDQPDYPDVSQLYDYNVIIPANLMSLTEDPPDPVAPPAPPTITQTTLSPTRLQCFGNSSWDNSLYYGAWRDDRGRTTRYATCAWYNIPQTTQSTQITITDAALTFKRNSDAGGSSAITVWLYKTDVPSSGDGNPKTNATKVTGSSGQLDGVLGQLDKGYPVTMSSASLVAAIQAIADGQSTALMLYADVTDDADPSRNYSGSRNYAKLEGSFDLSLVYKSTPIT